MKEYVYPVGCLLLCGLAEICLTLTGQIPGLGIVALFFLCLAAYLTLSTKKPDICLLLISGATTLILSFRFSSLVWGDPWQDYESVIEILTQGSLAMTGYRLQQPVLPGLVASSALITGYAPQIVQKFVPCLISALSAPMLYAFSKEYIGDRAALYGSLLFLAGVPYIHWATQGVRETMGIPFFIFALFFFIRILDTREYASLLILAPAIGGLILVHHQSALMFVCIGAAVLCARIYFIASQEERFHNICLGLGILGASCIMLLLWWKIRIPFIYSSFLITLNQILPVQFGEVEYLLILPSVVCIALLTLPVCIPVLPDMLRHWMNPHQLIMQWLLRGVQVILIAGMSLMGLGIISGYAPFTTIYSPWLILGVLVITALATIAVPSYLSSRQYFFLIWAVFPSMMTLGGLWLTKVLFESAWSIQIDPLRFPGYLWPTLSLIAGSTISGVKIDILGKVAVSLAFIFLLAHAFPPIVFGGTGADDRSLVIDHPDGELMAIDWFKNQGVVHPLSSDRYAIAPARWLNPLGYHIIEPQGRPGVWNGTTYWLITERMKRYANFDEWILRTPYPISQGEMDSFNRSMDREYDNGYAGIYRIRV